MKCPSTTFQNLPYFIQVYENPKLLFPFCATFFPLKNDLVCGFLYSKNMANFEAFHQVISSSINLLFLKSALFSVSALIEVKEKKNCNNLICGKNFSEFISKTSGRFSVDCGGTFTYVPGLHMIGYGKGKIILKFPPFFRLNEENQEREIQNQNQMKTKTNPFLFSFDVLNFPRSI